MSQGGFWPALAGPGTPPMPSRRTRASSASGLGGRCDGGGSRRMGAVRRDPDAGGRGMSVRVRRGTRGVDEKGTAQQVDPGFRQVWAGSESLSADSQPLLQRLGVMNPPTTSGLCRHAGRTAAYEHVDTQEADEPRLYVDLAAAPVWRDSWELRIPRHCVNPLQTRAP